MNKSHFAIDRVFTGILIFGLIFNLVGVPVRSVLAATIFVTRLQPHFSFIHKQVCHDFRSIGG